MDRNKKISDFLDYNLDTFLNDIMELAPKERAKAFLTLMNDKALSANNTPVKGIAPIEWVENASAPELRAKLAELTAKREAKDKGES